ncbi:terminase large subunit [Microbulbifer sp. PSTR4-B]|uniref:terminase large subunit n=1 Tax=Microbulbifer sp. PSTR4-B TaxID=3243396 RepID=UPI00403A645C
MPVSKLADPSREWLDRAYRYAEQVRSGDIPACRYVRLAVDRWYRDLETAGERGLIFDENAAAKVFRFTYQYCKHYQGEWAGTPIVLSDWQCFINANVFGWLRKADGRRRFRMVYEEIARKNGKTTKLASVGGYMAAGDSEPGAKVYCAATKRDQAKEVFDSIGMMAAQDRVLRKAMTTLRNVIRCHTRNSPNSQVELLAADYNSMDGFNVHAGIIDEVHAHRDSGVWDVLESGRGARRQPVMWGITTAGKNKNSFCYELRGYAIKVLEGTVEDDAFFGIIYTLDDDDDWKDPSVWIKANPNLGISVSLEDMQDQCRKAQEMPTAKIEFQTKRLNIWVYGESTWMNMERWNKCRDESLNDLACWTEGEESEFDGMACHGGLDLASVEDLTALTLDFKDSKGKHTFISRAYLPEAAFQNRIDKGGQLQQVYQRLKDHGCLVITPGDACDYSYIKQDILAACERFDVKEIAFDRFNSSQLVSDLIEEGVPMVQVGQGTGSISAPMKELLRLVLTDSVRHNNPALSFAMSNVVAVTNAAGDIKFDKSKVSEKIDPAVAAIMALSRQMVQEPETDLDDFLNDPINVGH